MKYLPVIVMFVASVLVIAMAQANTDKVYSAQGYPYKLLINRADEVKIFYREHEAGISCHVEISRNREKITSEKVEVSAEQFEQLPLASCLPRKAAKALLAITFSQYL
ncbi:hypothetical protein SG34_009400 [Thalassomonas viridans]|uniref:NusG domain-containing protein n=1 Tax=Thalassomonas viridans TaxID=137584 RepID=A0AAF0CAP0_9GAMM|nr:hypothetical protein [Thalassomonas viridans]WDE07078.1 hypothetical protein SG34_009400 [Thalassomonas viridans]